MSRVVHALVLALILCAVVISLGVLFVTLSGEEPDAPVQFRNQ